MASQSVRILLAREGRTRTFLPFTVVVFCLATIISLGNAKGDVILSARSSANLASGTNTQTGSAGTVSSAKAGSLGTDLTETRSSATFGQLRGYAAIFDGTTGTTGGTFATSTSFFRDDFLFNAEGKAGTVGTVEMKFKIDGTLSASSTLISGFGI